MLYTCMLAVGANNSMFQAIAAPLIRQLSLPAVAIGGLFSLSALTSALTAPLWGRFSDRIGRKPVILIGLTSVFASNALFAFAVYLGETGVVVGLGTFLCLMAARGVYGLFGSGVPAPAQAAVTQGVEPAARVRRIGMMMSAFTLGSIIGPGFAGAIAAQLGLKAPIIAFAGVGLALVLATILVSAKRQTA